MMIVSVATGERMTGAPTPHAVAAVAYLAVFGSLVGFSAYVFLLNNTRPAIATSYAYVNPAVAIALGVAWGGEQLDVASAAGAAIVLVSVLLLTRSKSVPKREGDELGSSTLRRVEIGEIDARRRSIVR